MIQPPGVHRRKRFQLSTPLVSFQIVLKYLYFPQHHTISLGSNTWHTRTSKWPIWVGNIGPVDGFGLATIFLLPVNNCWDWPLEVHNSVILIVLMFNRYGDMGIVCCASQKSHPVPSCMWIIEAVSCTFIRVECSLISLSPETALCGKWRRCSYINEKLSAAFSIDSVKIYSLTLCCACSHYSNQGRNWVQFIDVCVVSVFR